MINFDTPVSELKGLREEFEQAKEDTLIRYMKRVNDLLEKQLTALGVDTSDHEHIAKHTRQHVHHLGADFPLSTIMPGVPALSPLRESYYYKDTLLLVIEQEGYTITLSGPDIEAHGD